MKIDKLDFSVRTSNCLRRAGITTVEQLEELETRDLMALRGFGQKCLEEVHQKLAALENVRKREAAKGAPADGSYLHGYREGAEAMRSAIIRELTRYSRQGRGVGGGALLMACEIARKTEVG